MYLFLSMHFCSGDGYLKEFLESTSTLSPDERAKALEDDEVRHRHYL